jgi:hypothetical protein
MSVCLRCDGCSKAVSEHDEDFQTWWRLTRYGADWIEEPGAPASQMPMVSMHSVFFTGQGMVEMDSMPEFEDGDEAIEVEFDSEPPMAVVHFCSSACLAQWAGQAAALET